MKDNVTGSEKRWITNWNDYLGDLKYLFRWLHNYKLKTDQGLESNSSPSEWKTPTFAQIKKKRTKRLSLYSNIQSRNNRMQEYYNDFYDETLVNIFRVMFIIVANICLCIWSN